MTADTQGARQGSTVDYCERFPDEGHAWSTTKHAGLPVVHTRRCYTCGYLDVTEVQAEVARLQQDLAEAKRERNALVLDAADFLAERDSLAARLAEAEASLTELAPSSLAARLADLVEAAKAWAAHQPRPGDWRFPEVPHRISDALVAAADAYPAMSSTSEVQVLVDQPKEGE